MSDRPDDDHDEAEDEALAERLRRARLGGDLFDDLDRVADDVPDESVGDDPDDDDVADADAEVDGEDDPTAVPSADDDADDTADGGADEGDTADAGEAAEGAPARFRAFNVKLDPDDDHVEDDLGAAPTLAAKGRDRATPIPFGPYLAIAGWIVFMWGDELIGAYMSYAGLA